jgi:outer membrane receptor protein involved in Fe transport
VPIPTDVPVNAGRSIANGIELAVQGNMPESWRWGLSYRWENVSDTFPQGLSNLTTITDFEHTTPRHQVKANLGWADGPWEVAGYLTYQSRIFGFAPVTVPPPR